MYNQKQKSNINLRKKHKTADRVSIDEVDIMCHGLDLLLNAILLLSFIELCLVCFQISFTMTLLDFCWLIRKLPSYVHLALCWGDWHCD